MVRSLATDFQNAEAERSETLLPPKGAACDSLMGGWISYAQNKPSSMYPFAESSLEATNKAQSLVCGHPLNLQQAVFREQSASCEPDSIYLQRGLVIPGGQKSKLRFISGVSSQSPEDLRKSFSERNRILDVLDECEEGQENSALLVELAKLNAKIDEFRREDHSKSGNADEQLVEQLVSTNNELVSLAKRIMRRLGSNGEDS